MGLQHRIVRGAMKGALRLIYPPQCLCCGNGVAEDGALCPECWRDADFITAAACTRCGAPQPSGDEGPESERAGASLCDDCMLHSRPWRHGRAAMVYSGTGRRLVLALKHGDRPDLAPALAAWLSGAAGPVLRPGMVVVPVPVHWRRMLKRHYNQAELLSGHLARLRGLPHLPDALSRSTHRPAQDHRSVTERFDNIAGTIAVTARRVDALRGKAVLLVDDVMTSGATLATAAEALRSAGAGPISVCVLARAVKHH